MTPLAHRIVKELTLPLKERTFDDTLAHILPMMDDVHCFDMTEVMPLTHELQGAVKTKDTGPDSEWILSQFAFLPAPKTWVEFANFGDRYGFLLIEDGTGAEIKGIIARGDDFYSSNYGRMALAGSLDKDEGFGDFLMPAWVSDQVGYYSTIKRLYVFLALINSPRLIGRVQHMPHRGLERKLAGAKGLVGKFPLHAWTEIKLSVADIGKRADGTEYEAHYTGEKCLHFCRSHLRIRNGRLERVSAHWRGNPALGIKQSRYSVTA